MASTDERFRPVNLTTGPDGALYVADMYRGLIQHSAYVTPYLKEQTLNRHLEKPINRGRIWRIVPENWTPAPRKTLSAATTNELVATLSNADGWYRDMAQRLLVERNDKQAIPLLTELALKGTDTFGRFHALWTLVGMKQTQADLLLTLMTDQAPLLRSTALRLLEPIAQTNKSVRDKLGSLLVKNWQQASIDEILQIALSGSALEPTVSHQILAGIIDRHGDSPLLRDAVMSSLPNQEFTFLRSVMKSPQWQTHNPAKEIFLETLTTSVVKSRNPTELAALLTALDTKGKSLSWQEKAVLTGMSISGSIGKTKPIRLVSAPAILTKSSDKVDPSRLASLLTMFEWPGHVVPKQAVAKKGQLNEDDQKLFAQGRQLYLNTCSGCHGTDGAGMSRFAPTLIGSDWVTGDEKRLVLILLHGMEGPVQVAGKTYDVPDILPVMPAHSTMDDASLTAILTYIRNEWGNQAGPINRRVVGMTRVTSQGRVVPWTAKELNKYMLEASVK